jgi:hypothetical protein
MNFCKPMRPATAGPRWRPTREEEALHFASGRDVTPIDVDRLERWERDDPQRERPTARCR